MPNHTSFRLNRSGMLLALISAAFAGEPAAATGGRVDFATAGATVASGDGRQRPLAKGAELGTGDTVRTDAQARAQIRFSDGSYVSLQPNTEFAIKDYKYAGTPDGNERGIFGLARGAMRTVTGFIGRVNRNRYQITTPTATIGIRGTGGRIEVLLDGSTLIAGTSGIWTLTNPSGTLDVPAGTFGKAPAAPNQPPQQSTQGPDTGPAPLPVDSPKPVEVKGIEKEIDKKCQTDASSTACTGSFTDKKAADSSTPSTPPAAPPPNPNPPLMTGSGYHVSYAFGSTSGTPITSAINSSGSLANATFDATGQMTQFTATNSATFTGAHQEFGTAGGVMAWGRWTGTVSGTNGTAFSIAPGTSEGYHYIVGIPATAMPTVGSAVYTFIGATKPTGMLVALTPGTFTGTLTVTNWTTGTMTAGGTVAFTSPTTFSYTFNAPATFTPGSPAFSGSVGGIAMNGAAPSGYQCTGSCTAAVNGAFFGAGAAFAGFAYQITGIGNQPISGTAAFKQ